MVLLTGANRAHTLGEGKMHRFSERKMDGNDVAAEFILETKWEALPEPVRTRAKMCLLDDLGAVIGGTLTRVSHIAANYAAERMTGDESSILLHRKRSTAAGAAFANACAGNGLDIDDDIKYTRGHPGIQLFPAALAVAEKTNACGAALLEALVIGYEVASVTGRCWHDLHETYQACGSWGSIACAAAASRLMGLDHDKVKHALGIADYHAPNAPMMRDIDHPAMVKHAVGWGAMNGIMAAELAERGFTGIPSILGFDEYSDWVAALGSVYVMTDGVGIKRWCSCAWGHPALFATLKVIEENAIAVDEIERLSVHTFHEGWRLFQGLPKTTEEAQFSIKWPLATLLLDGTVGPDQVLEHRLADERVRALVEKIDIIEDPEIDHMYRASENDDDSSEGRFVGRTQVWLTDGRCFDSGIVGRRAYEWDAAALEAKFRWLAAFALDKERTDQLVRLVWDFDIVSSVHELTTLLQ